MYTWGGCMFVSCSQDKTIRFWDLRAAQAVNLIAPGSKTLSKGHYTYFELRTSSALYTNNMWPDDVFYDIVPNQIITVQPIQYA